ncbi:MAG: crotonase, partial [Gammaproteobacteria bacterium]|nr:crotonase [Gammaproteobacteria bacterium]
MTDKNTSSWNKIVDDQGIAWLHLDIKDTSLNTLSSKELEEFEQILQQLEQDTPAGVVILSDKKGGFIAGADINEFKHQENEEKTHSYILYCQSLFNRLEALDCPTVAIIHGYCMGGGTELALACTYRIADDSNNTR